MPSENLVGIKPENQTTVLMNSIELYRDCWQDENGWLTIRQVKFSEDGQNPECKIVRIDPKQQIILGKVMDVSQNR